MEYFGIKRIVADKGVFSFDLTRRLVERLPGLPVLPADPGSRLTEGRAGKETLYLQEYKGDFLKPCPGTREYI
ncbi:MAG: radical SAM protein, partial [candidate division WOR-3 bacterium]